MLAVGAGLVLFLSTFNRMCLPQSVHQVHDEHHNGGPRVSLFTPPRPRTP